jgi:hypothetical protein
MAGQSKLGISFVFLIISFLHLLYKNLVEALEGQTQYLETTHKTWGPFKLGYHSLVCVAILFFKVLFRQKFSLFFFLFFAGGVGQNSQMF